MDDLLYKPEKSRSDVEQLLAIHKNLVYFVLSDMSLLHNQDCESAAWEALWDAVETFDVYSTTAFSTYAVRLIKNGINNQLRKQSLVKQHEAMMLELAETNKLFLPVDTSDTGVIQQIDKAFAAYVDGKDGVCKNVLLAWQASGFEATGRTLATVCDCSPSYVTRVQRGFRAYLQQCLRGS